MLRLSLVILVVALIAIPATAAAAPAAVEFFRLPSGNIGCAWTSDGGGSIRCDVGGGLVPAPPRPSGCEFDWGSSLTLSRTGTTRVACISDTVLGQPKTRVVRYGTTWKRAGFACLAEPSGLICINSRGHGFFLSRQSWRTF